MITAGEARELNGELYREVMSYFYDDIKQRAIEGYKSADIKFLSGSNFDIFSKQIMKELEDNGYQCEYKVDKFLFIDLGFRTITVNW
jgi:hypothetical protein